MSWEYVWIVWLAVILVLVTIEMFTLEMTFLMLGLGATGGLITSLSGGELWLQIVVAAAVALLLLLFVRPPLLRALRKGEDPAKSNVEALIGLYGIVTTPVTHVAGEVKLSNGDVWTARLPRTSEAAITEGTTIVVADIDGATALVAPRTEGGTA